jgi:hypothetical protein
LISNFAEFHSADEELGDVDDLKGGLGLAGGLLGIDPRHRE